MNADRGPPDLQIGGCTAVIQSGRQDQQNLAIAFSNRGIGYTAKGDYENAIADLNQAIKLDSHFAVAFRNRGLAFYYQKEYERAIADYSSAIKLNPKDADAFNNRGLAYQSKGDFDQAISDYGKALRINRDFSIAANNVAEANRLKSQAAADKTTNVIVHLIDPAIDQKGEEQQRQIKLFVDVFEHVRKDYVEKPDEWRMVEGAIKGLMKAPDVPSGIEETEVCKEQLSSHAANDALVCFGRVYDQAHKLATATLTDGAMVESALNGMLRELDKVDKANKGASSYLDPKTFRDMQVQSRGEFGGIGTEIKAVNGSVKVVSVFEEAPAARAGILKDDTIEKVDGNAVHDVNEAVARLRGPVNTLVKVTVTHKGSQESHEFNISREVIRVMPVSKRTEWTDVAYVRISQFNEAATSEVKKAIADLNSKLNAEKIKGYILDLRNDPGGLLDQAISLTDAFLDAGEIVTTKGRETESDQKFNARPGDLVKGKPVIVLVNHGTAGSSEILAAALQDHKRATIVGTRSAGRGSVQTIIPLGGGNGALRLTTARFYRPNGRPIDGDGIKPDVEVTQNVPDDARADPSIDPQTYVPAEEKDDATLQMALDLIRGVEKNAAFPANGKR